MANAIRHLSLALLAAASIAVVSSVAFGEDSFAEQIQNSAASAVPYSELQNQNSVRKGVSGIFGKFRKATASFKNAVTPTSDKNNQRPEEIRPLRSGANRTYRNEIGTAAKSWTSDDSPSWVNDTRPAMANRPDSQQEEFAPELDSESSVISRSNDTAWDKDAGLLENISSQNAGREIPPLPENVPGIFESTNEESTAPAAEILNADDTSDKYNEYEIRTTPAPTRKLPDDKFERVPEYRIRTGDMLTISIPYEDGSRWEVPVRPDGRISYLYDIETMAAGLTYKELNNTLRKKLARYYKNPRVTVIGKSFAGNSVFVMGPVGKPGSHVVQSDTRLLDVLANAGALSLIPQVTGTEGTDARPQEIVNLDDAYVARGDRILEVNFRELLMNRDMSQNVLMHPKDFIFIPSTFSMEKKVYVVGKVNEPLVYRFNTRATFMEAVIEAGDTLETVALNRRCYIVRGRERKLMDVDYAAIQMGKAADIALMDGDIIYVPERSLSYTSRTITNVINEVLSPMQSVLDGHDMAKEYYQKNWQLPSRGKARLK